jgi:hypothetical protein
VTVATGTAHVNTDLRDLLVGPRERSPVRSGAMLQQLRVMPNGVRIFLVYSALILAVLGLTMPLVVDQAIEAPVSPIGIVYMLLLAYSIFTVTLVLQRKQAAYPLALGLATLSLPLVPIVFLSPAGLTGAVIMLVVAVVLLWGLRRRSTRGWFIEP